MKHMKYKQASSLEILKLHFLAFMFKLETLKFH